MITRPEEIAYFEKHQIPYEVKSDLSPAARKIFDPPIEPGDWLITDLVPALMSGKYLQGQGFLEHTIDGVAYQCCLGVACVIHPGVERVSTLDPEEAGRRYDHYDTPIATIFDNDGFEGVTEFTSRFGGRRRMDQTLDSWGEEVGIENGVCICEPNGIRHSLSSLNDEHGWSFVQIANLIVQVKEMWRNRAIT